MAIISKALLPKQVKTMTIQTGVKRATAQDLYVLDHCLAHTKTDPTELGRSRLDFAMRTRARSVCRPLMRVWSYYNYN
uniref:Aconitate hydratase n=1 Tax=Panagrellus redivivus TaxID=6233 RepID=A0A7E5A2A7_PANRE